VDAIDGALRRPGRFDRELAFPLPNAEARGEILRIHTRGWEKPPPPLLLDQLAARCVGYCGGGCTAV
jgi:SpoVK/Ycf46/Vps4 family AAA+-type ATPase